MSEAPAEVVALSAKLREVACHAHNASRAESNLPPSAHPAWDAIDVDQRNAWRGVAAYVLANYTYKGVNPELLVQACAAEVANLSLFFIKREEAEGIARAVLRVAGLIGDGKPQTQNSEPINCGNAAGGAL